MIYILKIENHAKYWKTLEISYKCYLLFLVLFKWTVYYLLKCFKFSVEKQTIEKNNGIRVLH